MPDATRPNASGALLEPIRTVAVVGAGMAGLSCAGLLEEAGIAVTVFDKSRGPSGRLSTRRRAAGQWDHGAPYFEARNAAFRAQCRAWEAAGLVVEWGSDDTVERWVGVPRMSAIGRHLVGGLALETGIRVASLVRQNAGWQLIDSEKRSHGLFDAVVLAIPAPQAAELVSAFPAVQAEVAAVTMLPVHTLLVAFEEGPAQAAVLRPSSGPLKIVVPNWTKPERPSGTCWVAHTHSTWSRARLETDPEALQPMLLDAFQQATGITTTPQRTMVHRWRYAHTDASAGWPEGHRWDPATRLGLTGDWCAGRGVEAGWQSGTALANRIRALREA